jgi:hypothetical protein
MVKQIITNSKIFLFWNGDSLPKVSLNQKHLKMENKSEVGNLEIDCVNGVPSFGQFMSAIHGEKLVILIYPAVFFVIIAHIYSKNLRNLIKNAPRNIKLNCIFLVSIYPIASICSFFAVLVPRAYLFCDSVSHVAFMIIAYQLYR